MNGQPFLASKTELCSIQYYLNLKIDNFSNMESKVKAQIYFLKLMYLFHGKKTKILENYKKSFQTSLAKLHIQQKYQVMSIKEIIS